MIPLHEHRPRLWQRATMRVVSLKPLSWVLSHTLHRLDRPVMQLTEGRQSATGLFTGLPIVTLTTIGAKSGQPRSAPLVAIPDGDNVVVIASNFGRSRHPAWYHNLRVNPQATLSRKGGAGVYIAHEASGEERERLWRKAVGLYPGYAAYARRTGGRVIPVMVLTPRLSQPAAQSSAPERAPMKPANSSPHADPAPSPSDDRP